MNLLDEIGRVLRGEGTDVPLLPLTPGPAPLAPTGADDPPDHDPDDPSPAARRIDQRDAPRQAPGDTPAELTATTTRRPERFPVHLLDPVPTIAAPCSVLYAETRTLGSTAEYVGLDPSAAAGARVAYCVVQVTSATGTAYVHAGRSALNSQRFPLAAGAGLALDGLGGLWLSSPDAATVSILVAGTGPAPR